MAVKFETIPAVLPISYVGLDIAEKSISRSKISMNCDSATPVLGRVHSYLKVHADLYTTLNTFYKTIGTFLQYDLPQGVSWLGAAQLLSVIPSMAAAKDQTDGLIHAVNINDTEGEVTSGIKLGNHLAAILSGLLFIPTKGLDIAMSFTAAKTVAIAASVFAYVGMALGGIIVVCTAALASFQCYKDIEFYFALRGGKEKFLSEHFSITEKEKEKIWENVLKELSRTEKTGTFKQTMHSMEYLSFAEIEKIHSEIVGYYPELSIEQKATLLKLVLNECSALKERKEAYLIRRLGKDLVEKLKNEKDTSKIIESVRAENVKKILISFGLFVGALGVGALFLAIVLFVPPPFSFAIIGVLVGIGLLAAMGYDFYAMQTEINSHQKGKGELYIWSATSLLLISASAAAIIFSAGIAPAILGIIYLVISLIISIYYIYYINSHN